jgi:uncharacterized protein (TIGR02145 family)
MRTKNKIWLCTLTVTGLILILTDSCKKDDSNDSIPITYGTVTDLEGNVYKTIQIEIPTAGTKSLETAQTKTQVWMAENLRTTKYNDGTSIPYEPDPVNWEQREPKYTWYNGNEATDTFKETYGALYNWYAVNTEKLCPTGWHVTSDEEWQTLGRYLMNNGFNYDGTIGETYPNKVAKSLAAKTDWASSSNAGAPGNTDYPEKRNAIGFSALPGGFIYYSMGYQRMSLSGFWWSSEAGVVNIDFDDSAVIPQTNPSKINGCSIRCVKDL